MDAMVHCCRAGNLFPCFREQTLKNNLAISNLIGVSKHVIPCTTALCCCTRNYTGTMYCRTLQKAYSKPPHPHDFLSKPGRHFLLEYRTSIRFLNVPATHLASRRHISHKRFPRSAVKFQSNKVSSACHLTNLVTRHSSHFPVFHGDQTVSIEFREI